MFEKIEENIIWPLERLWENITMIPRGIKWFYQRGRRGYSDCDLWGLDCYLDDILAKGLRQLAKKSCSYPGGVDDIVESVDWDKRLNEMADGFQARIDYENEGILEDDDKFSKRKEAYKKHAKSLKLLQKWYYYLWD